MADVLVVDDDPDIRMLVSFALEDAGHDVRQASDGREALVQLQERAPDLMVIDVMMPHLDGFGVLRAMAAQRLAPTTRIIVLTCKTDERDHLRGLELGAHEYLTKPFDPEHLIDQAAVLLRSTAEQLHARRQEELEKAELLNRLESAFARRA